MSTTSATTSADPTIQPLVWAREMKKERRKQAAQEAAEVAGEGATLRQKVAAARLAKEAAKEKVKEKVEEKMAAPLRAGTAWALRAAWINLLDSFGLTLIYINMHVFLRWVFPDAFCKLGEEWVPKQVAPKSTKNIAGTAFGIVEVMGLFFLDLLALFMVLGAVFLLITMANFMLHPIDSAVKLFSLNWQAIKALISLFAGLLSS